MGAAPWQTETTTVRDPIETAPVILKGYHIGTRFFIEPVGKPRMTRNGIYNKGQMKPNIARYMFFKDRVRKAIDEAGMILNPDELKVEFVLPMAKSWSQKKRFEQNGRPHLQRPDLDNMIKALLDAAHAEDSHFWNVSAVKLWGERGSIAILT